MMLKRDLKLELDNIQHQYPLSEILHQTLVVNSTDMSLMTFKEAKESPIKSRPTARKSTNSKLKFSQRHSEHGVVNCVSDHTKENGMDFAYADSPNSEIDDSSGSSNSLRNSINDSVELKSIICSDNKIKITKRTSSDEPRSLSPFRNDSNDCEASSETVSALFEEFNNITPNKPADSPKSDDKAAESDDSGCATNVSSSDPQSDSLKLKLPLPTSKENEQINPPIKLVVSNIHDSPVIQNSSTLTSITASNLHSSADVSSSEDVTKVKPSAVANDISSETTVKSKTATRKLKIEDIVDTLNSKQNKLSNSFLSESGNTRKRSIDNCLLTPDSSPKKLKFSEEDEDIKDEKFAATCNIKSISNEHSKNKIEVGTNTCFANLQNVQMEVEKHLQEHLQNEIDLRIKLHLKNEKYTNLKEKYESLEDTFRSWIRFADDLQTRVKKLAMHLLKQQETVKVIQAKSAVQKVTVGVQTDKELLEKSVKNHHLLKPAMKTFSTNVAHVSPCKSTNITAPKLTSPVTSKVAPNMVRKVTGILPKPRSDVIDLTDDAENSRKQNAKPSMGDKVQRVQRILEIQQAMKSAVSNPLLSSSNTSKNSPSQTSLSAGSTLHGYVGINNQRLRSNFPPPVSTSSICFGDQRALIRPVQQAVRTPSSSKQMNNLDMIMGRINVRHPTAIQPLRHPPPKIQPIRQAPPRLQQPQKNTRMQIVRSMLTPAPYPPLPTDPVYHKLPRGALPPPPELKLGIKKANGGIVLSWNNLKTNPISAKVVGYELYAYHQSTGAQQTWKKIGEDTIAAMELPMACTLSHFSTNSTYFFAVRGKDLYGRYGSFSQPCNSKEIT